ncbi:DUF4405 domain-containing protein [Magnetovibrio sp. PR-2]|uniref:DUF4405 domain-containing protein n=1 Tax=Magnetovibrio sp. PR-2 TaxID=3120356 RepID=UPI002FCE4573
MNTPKKKTSYRAMTSLVTTWAFVVATVTGVVLYITPQGRIANWVVWDLGGLTKTAWGELHIIFSIVFVVVGVVHLVYNWKPFKNYMAERAKGHVHVRNTVYGSLIIIAVFFGLSLANVPPASWIFDLEDQIKDSWITSPDFEPPFGHAEDVSLVGFAKRQFIDLPKAIDALNGEDIEVPDRRMKLKDIAAVNSTTPMHIYMVIRHLEDRPAVQSSYTPEEVEAQFAGTGVGRKTAGALAKELQMGFALFQGRLKLAGIEIKAEDKIKPIAEAHGIEALDVVKMALIEGYRP